jgi:hypothetical protein
MVKSSVKEKIKAISVFARHETFHPRFGWLKKGYDLALEDSEIFFRDDAPVLLGVGKNMVRSIRYWCNAFKVLKEKGHGSEPTAFGQQLLADEGWDPFLENPASLWLLHWNLLKDPCAATAWAYVFGTFQATEFTQEKLLDELQEYASSLGGRVADSSLKKDVSCILRMYAEQESRKGLTEDSIDCPFTDLGLLFSVGDGRRYEFQVGSKETLPAEIVVAACLEFAHISQNESLAMGISRLAHIPGSPGRVFKLPEASIADAIEALTHSQVDLYMSDSAGLQQLRYEADPLEMSEAILNEYFAAQRVAV